MYRDICWNKFHGLKSPFYHTDDTAYYFLRLPLFSKRNLRIFTRYLFICLFYLFMEGNNRKETILHEKVYQK